jgi:hypothetical protein
VTTEGITDDDERLHPVEDPSPHWSDSLYFNAWDPGSDTFVMTRIAVLANAPRVTAGLVAWHRGAVVYAYGRELDALPAADWDVMEVEGLTYRMLASRRSWAVQLRDGDAQAHLEWHGDTEPVSYQGHPDGPLPRPVAWGHYEQTCRVTGDHWAGLLQWHWVTGFLADGRSFNLFEVLGPDDVCTVNGYVQDRDGTDYVVGAQRDLVRSGDGGAERFGLRLELAGGGGLELTGGRAAGAIPVRPAADQPVVVHETPVRLRAADGTPGHGVYEHLVTEYD